ncbi:MAG: hypothetical protein FP814_10235 [Desulfobacterium sp.]|nr:hypothetical protein [Desulfobacterium sp.]MBU3947797.1 hypothetical protein [Pseudomonadota bacterium]MBU4036116.1 hypothetical protein [Pseudomonadota bacterium]
MNQSRWLGLMELLGVAPSLETYNKLKLVYSEPHRHYHTIIHINDCLTKLDSVIKLVENAVEVEAAIWFHDAIYKPYASDNELKSANWAKSFFESMGVNKTRADKVYGHIMATLHNEPAKSSDSRLIADIDLSILGSEPDDYQVYEKAVRKEYKWVPYFIYRKKRRSVLSSLLERDFIYSNNYFQIEYEEKARENMAIAIAKL